MGYVSDREKELMTMVIPQNNKVDFEDFWKAEVDKLRKVPIEIERKKLITPYDKTTTTYEISFNTHDATIVNAYFCYPVNANNSKLPCVVYYHGGNGSKAIHHDIVATGVCCFAMDVRSQGGTTIDKADYSMGDFRGGLMTRDVLSKETFYMRNIYLDAVRAVDVVSTLAEVDEQRIVTYGASQGGALSIVAAALSGKVIKSFSAVTSYCCLKQRVEAGSGIFNSVNQFLTKYPEHTDAVFDTLTYFDINNMVSLLKVPVSFMIGLTDPICLPHFVYSAYAHTPSEKELMSVPFTPHTIAEEYINKTFFEFTNL